MNSQTIRSVLLFVPCLLIVEEVQGQDPDARSQTERDVFAAEVSEYHGALSKWRLTAFDWRTNPTGGEIGHVADDVLASWERNHGRLVKAASAAMDHKVVRFLGAEMFIASSYGTVGGHLYEGNLQSAGVAALDELAKTGAAYAGAKAVGGVGATYGFAIAGPPGMMVGGLIGAVGGAAAAVWGYNTAVSPTLTGTYEKLLEPDHEHYLNLARESRREFLALQATRKLEEALARDPLLLKPHEREDADFLMRHTPGLQPPSTETTNVPKLSAPGADNPDRWKDLESRAKRLAKEAAENPLVTKKADPDTIPVIPEVAVIDAVLRVPETAEVIRWSFSKRGKEVSGQSSYELPGRSGPTYKNSGFKIVSRFVGTVQDNVFSGQVTDTVSPWETRSWSPDGKYKQGQRITYAQTQYDCEVAFQSDGAVQIRFGKSTVKAHAQIIEGPGEDYDSSDERKPWTANGVWQYREAVGDEK